VLDVLLSFAEVARTRGWVRPEVSTGGELVIDAGRHPVLEELLPPGTLVANDLALSAGGETAPAILLVTGPNMGGKSTFIRQAALVAVEVGVARHQLHGIGSRGMPASGHRRYCGAAHLLALWAGRLVAQLDDVLAEIGLDRCDA
jgi:dsDNA-specific endonuclease/ATPase MutS2